MGKWWKMRINIDQSWLNTGFVGGTLDFQTKLPSQPRVSPNTQAWVSVFVKLSQSWLRRKALSMSVFHPKYQLLWFPAICNCRINDVLLGSSKAVALEGTWPNDPNIAPVLGGHRSQLLGVSLQALRQEVCHVSCFLPEANGCEMGGWSMFVENY
jgi:hypothetical protein